MQKINLVLFKFSLKVGGAEKQLLLLANHLPSECFNIFVTAKNSDNNLINQFSQSVDFNILPKMSFLKSVLFLRSIFKKKKINICHCWDFKSSILGLFATFFSNVQLIDGSVRSAPSRKLRFYYLYKMKYCFFRFIGIPIISNSKAGLACYGLTGYKKGHMIHNALIPEKPSNTDEKINDEFKIAMLANMRWKKDYLTFIKAGLELLKINQNVKFYLIGDGPDKENYFYFLRDNPLKKHFIFTGFQADPRDYLKKMDVCVLLNNDSGEGLSNSIMEYMSHAKPVVATDLGGNNELVKHGESGYLVKESDYREIAQRLNFLIDNQTIRKKMGEFGYGIINNDFSIKKMVIKYKEMYDNYLLRSKQANEI